MKYIRVKVKPNRPETRIVSQTSDEVIVEVAASPRNNEANIELIKFLSKHFNSNVKILKGKTSKNKIVEIDIT
ncbi:MAG: DUF167 domain-containing protein [Candidatus Nanoarchaeia archaeon]